MRNTIVFGTAVTVLIVASACGGRDMTVGSGPQPTTAASDSVKAGQVWSGYVERFKFKSGSDRITITFDSPSSGTVVLGEPPTAGDVADPHVAFPVGCKPYPSADGLGAVPDTFSECAERFAFTMRGAVAEDQRLRFDVEVADKWGAWCAEQTSIYYQGSTSTTIYYTCATPLPPGQQGHCTEARQGTTVADVNVDCDTAALCAAVCSCTSTACSQRESVDPVHFDLRVQGNMADGSSDIGQVHLTRQ